MEHSKHKHFQSLLYFLNIQPLKQACVFLEHAEPSFRRGRRLRKTRRGRGKADKKPFTGAQNTMES